MSCTTSRQNLSSEEVEKMSVTASTAGPDQYVRKMYQIESQGDKDQQTTLEKIGRSIGVSSWTVTRIMKGERKTFNQGFVQRIRSAYLDLCETQIKKLEEEIAIERAEVGNHDDLENLAEEALALRNRIQKAKGKAR